MTKRKLNIHDTSIGFQLTQLVKLRRQFIDNQMKQFGLTRTQWQVLFWLNTLGPCSQKELLKNLEVNAGFLARVLEALEKKEYIVRSRIKSDRRSLFIELTEYCKDKLIPHIKNVILKEDLVLLNEINQNEADNLIKLLYQLKKNLETALKI